MVAADTRARPAPVKSRISAAGRAKKPFRPVATNIASYDRKDPFAAVDALRKLLTTLPTRSGTNQLKMTADEHRLSMHLLTIVEPFIGSSPSPRGLTRQPTENLDEIASYVDSKRDLLSLALSCKRMYGVIFPRHFEYRVIRCKISNIAVWSYFANSRALASNVRRLEILDERSTEIPRIPSDILASDTELESSDDELDKIWSTLLKCQSLRMIEVNDNLVFSPISEESTSSDAKQANLKLPYLSSVAVRSFKKGYGQNKNPDLGRVTEMLHHCPNLQELNIDYKSQAGFGSPRADNFFLCGRWPSLRTLNLTHLSCSLDGFDAASAFFAAHPNVEVLHLDIGPRTNLRGLVLAPGSLPRLRELKSSKEFACLIISCPSENRPLETIKGVRMTGPQRDAAFLEALRRSDIRRIDLAGYGEFEDIRRLVDCAPKLTWLDIGKKTSASAHKGPVTISSVVDWANLLTQLPDLTTFHGIPFFYEVSSIPTSPATISDRSRIKKNDEVTSVLAWKCPNLRRVDHWEEQAGKVIVLFKDGDKAKWEVRRVKV
ncbi:hypothetical protein A7U60_g8000 [Sanghuangporus baumii]|uniref:F-box domain-containing protein n=1 Tax=Sanghuangporus baumii TaxID=108892 RepID=A0A9Q5HS77_SANBA|nr:hypothetical protein A7U60_g8000 [Sanghuangporus baumii]